MADLSPVVRSTFGASLQGNPAWLPIPRTLAQVHLFLADVDLTSTLNADCGCVPPEVAQRSEGPHGRAVEAVSDSPWIGSFRFVEKAAIARSSAQFHCELTDEGSWYGDIKRGPPETRF